MAELFTRRDETYFARTLGVNNLRAHFNQMEKALRNRVGHDLTDVSEQLTETHEILFSDDIFRHLVVQRSRAYARESQIRETGLAAAFPARKPPQVAAYSIRKTYGRLLDMFENAFTQQNPLFTLPMYYPLAWYTGPDTRIDPFEQNRQKQVVGLIRTNFLKRFESSVVAFELSCDRLLRSCWPFSRFIARPWRRRGSLSTGSQTTPRSLATHAVGNSSSGVKTETNRRTTTSCPRRCSMRLHR